MLMCKMQSHLKAIKNILHLKAIKILDQKNVNAIMNYMGMNHAVIVYNSMCTSIVLLT